LTASADLTTRRSADGRRPVDNCTEFFDVGVCQIRAATEGSGVPITGSKVPQRPALAADELTVVLSWAEAIAEVLAHAPGSLDAVLGSARGGSEWRSALGLADLTPQLSRALDVLVRTTTSVGDDVVHSLITQASEDRPEEPELDALVRHLLRSALEQRETRQMRTNGRASASL
jgi:hypothetical protein